MQKLISNTEGDISAGLKASGFRKEHQIVLEAWATEAEANSEDGSDEEELQDQQSARNQASHSGSSEEEAGTFGSDEDQPGTEIAAPEAPEQRDSDASSSSTDPGIEGITIHFIIPNLARGQC